MRFTCEKTALNDAVSVCGHAVGSKGTSPVMEGLLIQAGSSVTVSGFNYKTAIQKTFEAEVAQTGSVVLNARILADIVRRLPSDMVEINVDDRLMATIRVQPDRLRSPGIPRTAHRGRKRKLPPAGQPSAGNDFRHPVRRWRQ